MSNTPVSAPLAVGAIAPGRTFNWPVPGSKSITNRALVLAALADGTTVLDNVLDSDDTRHMLVGLQAMGVAFSPGVVARQLTVEGGLHRLRSPAAPVFVGNSGTTVRFLAGLAALLPGATTLVGDDHMARRPIADLVEGLRQLGVPVDCPTGCPPLTVHGGGIRTGRVRMRGDRSSQYFSALLLVAGLGSGDLTIEIEGTLVSRPYVDMTRAMVAAFGGRIDETPTGFVARQVPRYAGTRFHIEPDASAASYPFALAAAGRHAITVEGLDGNSLQGDTRFVDILSTMGAIVDVRDGRTRVTGTGRLVGVDVDMHHISDTVMTLAAIAPLAEGPTTILNVANIRLKETDRLAAIVTELQRLGQQVEHGDDWLRVTPRPLSPAVVECYGDHRIAMSFAVLGAIAGGIEIADPASAAKTYPGFWDDLAAFGRS
jgi:3-phosphoshikimate 1-carboxyvinyltransferase